jgi:hypothetical protein
MKALTSLAATLALALPAMTVQANELAGIKLGMSLAEAKSSLAANVKGLKILTVSDNGIENGVYGGREKGIKEDEDSVLAFKGDAEAIWFIGRSQFLPNSQRFPVKTLIDALRKKYGKESHLSSEREFGQMEWFFDKNNRLFIGHQYTDGSPCPDTGFVDRKGIETPNKFFEIPRRIGETCNLYYKATWSPDENGLIMRLDVTVIDYSLMNKYLQQRDSKEKMEREKKVKQQSGVKPNL